MKTIDRIALIDPFQALHDAWHTTSPEGVVATSSVGFAGHLALIDWSGTLTAVCLAGGLVFGVVCQCVKQWRQMQIDVDVYRRRAEQPVPAPILVSASVRPEGEGAHPQ